MLETMKTGLPLEIAVCQYLRDTLGIDADLEPFTELDRVPYFVQEAFELRQLRLHDRPLLLALDRHAKGQRLGVLRTQLDKIAAILRRQVVYVTGVLASYERKRLIEQKVPFIVPGNQMYLPDLGIDLREYFRKRPPAPEAVVSPATQAILIATLLRQPWPIDWQPMVLAEQLGYTSMTVSRAVRELEVAEIVTSEKTGRRKRLLLPPTPLETWERAQRVLRTPVRRRFWTINGALAARANARAAGLTALARYSSLAEPANPCFAIGPPQRRGAGEIGGDEFRQSDPDMIEWQVWIYDPAGLPGAGTVDPLSLTLSLRDERDERVQIALGELRKQMPW